MGRDIQFRLGPPARPDIKHDNGFLDKFPMRKPTTEDEVKYAKWKAKLWGGKAVNTVLDISIPFIKDFEHLPDGLEAYKHFLEATGTDRHFDYDRFLADDPSGRLVLISCRLLARQAAEQLYHDLHESRIKLGGMITFRMTSSATVVGGEDQRFPYPETENWQKAIGGHSLWISATVTVGVVKNCPPVFSMCLTIHAEDRYNFNPGQQDIKTGVPDSENGLFEITGLAKQYTQYGESNRMESWIGKTLNIGQVLYNLPGTW